ncbi:MAG: chorismate mutase [Candidatus Nanopelagicales bacterium]
MTDDATAQIAALRQQIDAADAAIAEAIAHRRSLSARIQEVRRTAGGPPREPSREEVVVAAYAERLGHGGADVGRAVLHACLPPQD